MEIRENLADKLARETKEQQAYVAQLAKEVEHLKEHLGRIPTCHVTTFGCQMNARDSEKLLGILLAAGYEETESEDADFVIYNTCSVRENADQRVYGRLGVLKGYKNKNREMKIAICGCMTQEDIVIEKLQKSYSFVDLIFGTHNLYKFPQLMTDLLSGGGPIMDIWKDTDITVEDLPVARKYSYKSGINIMYGCDNFCTYCIVPYVRGRERSRDKDAILEEMRKLSSDGVKEIMLLGQNVNSYGKNLPDKTTFAQLLAEAEKVEGIERIRFMTPHPKDFSDDVIEVMKGSSKICRHIHLPLQSGSSRILKRMNRNYTKEQYLDLALKIRRELPDVAITTDIIVGFPGESMEDVQETIDVIRKVEYDNAFTFQYSKRTGTPASRFEDQVPQDMVQEGFDLVLKEVQEMARKRTAMLQGKVEYAMVEEVNDHDPSLMTGRLSNNTIVHFKGDASLIGQIVPVSLDVCQGFYYLGTRQ
ncbi:MAG: tRNA (N6-isopentenyl adenosine(37)-C2)-methylthiotransferase MiaB [Lachnospiraceae bacterium]|nr:tRNA (N6-isopentenyl adenosine(37)-C2)-methylthiotransferase MiaB [Lachnospiraceae bacterium]